MIYSRRILIIPDAQITPDVVKSVSILSDAGGANVLADGESSRSVGRPIRGARYRHYQREDIVDSTKTGRARAVTMVVDRLGETDSKPKLFRSDTVVNYKPTDRESHQFEPKGSSSARGVGELMPDVSGDPSADFKGNLLVTSPGSTGDARFSWNTAEEFRDGKYVPGDANFRQSPNVFGAQSSVLNTVEGSSSPGSGGVSSDTATGSFEEVTRYLCRPKIFNMKDGAIGCVYLNTSLPPHHWQLASNMDPSSSDLSSRTEALSCKAYFQVKSAAGVWGAPVELTDEESYPGLIKDGSLEEIAFIDCVMDPVTDDIVCFVGKNVPDVQSSSIYTGGSLALDASSKNLGQSSFCTGKFASTRTILTITSSDGGTTWSRRSSASSETDPMGTSSHDSGIHGIPSDDIGLILGGSCEIMNSGRVVIALVTGECLYLVCSDDMGKTFRAKQVKKFSGESSGSGFVSLEKKEPKTGLKDGESWVVESSNAVNIHGIFHNNPAPASSLSNINATSPDGRVFLGAASVSPRTGWELHVEELRSTPPRWEDVSARPGARGTQNNIVYSKVYAVADNASGEWSGYSGYFGIAYRGWHADSPERTGWIMTMGTGVGNQMASADYYNQFKVDSVQSSSVTVSWSTGGYNYKVVRANWSTESDPWYWLLVQPGAGWHFDKQSTGSGSFSDNVVGFVTPTPGRYFFVKHGEYAGSRVLIEGNKQRDESIDELRVAPSSPTNGQRALIGMHPSGWVATHNSQVAGMMAVYNSSTSSWSTSYQSMRFIPDGRAIVVVGDSPNDTDSFAGHENMICLLESGGLDGTTGADAIPGKRLMSDHVGFWTKFTEPGEVTVVVSNNMIELESASSNGSNFRDPVETRTRSQASDMQPGGPLINMDGVWVEDEDVGRFLSHPGEIATYNEQDDSWSFVLPEDGYYAKDSLGDTYVFSRPSRQWSKVENPDSEPAFMLAKKTKARETISNTSMTKSKDGRLFFAVAYTDFSETININPLTNYWIQDDLLGKDGTQHGTAGSDFSYPFVMEDSREILVSYASRRMEVHETTDGESSRLVDGWVNSVIIDDADCVSTNVSSHDGTLSYTVQGGSIIGSSSDLPYGPCVLEPCVVVRPDGRLQVYGASHNWLPPQYEGLQNDSKINDGYISSVSGTSFRRGEAMHAAVISGLASATVDVDSELHRLSPAVNVPCLRNAVAPSPTVSDDQFSSSAIAVSSNGLGVDPENNSGSQSLVKRAHARKVDTRRATAAFLASPIASGLGCGLVSPGLVSIKSPNGIVYRMSFMWGIYPKRPSISVDSTRSVERYSGTSSETHLSVGRTEKLSSDRFGGIDFVAIDRVFTPPVKVGRGDVFLVADSNAFNSTGGLFSGKDNNLACYEMQSDGTLGWTFRSRFASNTKLLVLSEGGDGVYTAITGPSSSGSNIESWDQGLVAGLITEKATISWNQSSINASSTVASFTVASFNYSAIDNKTYITYASGVGISRHLEQGLNVLNIGQILYVNEQESMIVVSGSASGIAVSGSYVVEGREVTLSSSSSSIYGSGSFSDVSIGDYFVLGSQKFYVTANPSSTNSLKVLDLHSVEAQTNLLSSGSSLTVFNPGDRSLVQDLNAATQQVYWHSDSTGNLPRRPANQFAGFIGGYSGLDAISTESGMSVVSSKVYQKTFGNGSPSTIRVYATGTFPASWNVGIYGVVNKTLVFYSGDTFLFSAKVLSSSTQYSLDVYICDYNQVSPRAVSLTQSMMKVHEADTSSTLPARLAGGASQMCSGFDVLEYAGGDRRFLRSISQYYQKDLGGIDFGFRRSDSSSITENQSFYWQPIRENLGRTDSASSVGGFSHWEETAQNTDVFLHQENMSHAESKSLDVLNRRFRLIGGRYYAINWFGDVSPSSAGMSVSRGVSIADGTSEGHLSIVNAGSTESGKVFSRSVSGLRQRQNVVDAGGGFYVSNVQQNSGGFNRQSILAEPERTWLLPFLGTATTAPSSPTVGRRLLIVNGAGVFSGHTNSIAVWSGSSWSFTAPVAGNAIESIGELDAGVDILSYVWDGTNWVNSVRESAVQVGDSLLYDDNNTQRTATVVSSQATVTGYTGRVWRPGYFSSVAVQAIPESDPNYRIGQYTSKNYVRIELGLAAGLNVNNVKVGQAIKLSSTGLLHDIEKVSEAPSGNIYVYVVQSVSSGGTGPSPWNLFTATFSPTVGASHTASEVEIRHTITLDYGYGVNLSYNLEGNQSALMNFHAPAEDSLISIGKIPLDMIQISFSELSALPGKYVSPRNPDGTSTGNLYEVSAESTSSKARIDISNCVGVANSATRVSTFSAPRTSGISSPGGVHFVDWDYVFSFSSVSSTYDSGTGQTVFGGVSTTSPGFWSYLSSGSQKYVTGLDSSGDAFTYSVVSSVESSSTITVSGSSDARGLSTHVSVHDLELASYWGDTAQSTYDGSLPFRSVQMGYVLSQDSFTAAFKMDDPNYDGMATLQSQLFTDTSYTVTVNTIATNGSRITDEQPGFMFDLYSADTVGSVSSVSQSGGGAVFSVTKDTYSIASIGTGVSLSGSQIGSRLPFPSGFGCAPIHDGLKRTHHADPFAGGFRAIFAPVNTNSEITGDSSTALSSNIFFSMMLHGSAWDGYAGGTSAAGCAGLFLRAKLQTSSSYKEVILELVNGSQELKRWDIDNGSVVANGVADVIGKTTIKFDGLNDLNFVEVLVGMESAVSASNPDQAPVASIVHAFARPVDSNGRSNRSFSTICNYRRVLHSSKFSNNPIIGYPSETAPSVETVSSNETSGHFDSGSEHFMFGVSAKGVRTMGRSISDTPVASGISMVVKQVSVHRPGNSIAGSGLIALNSDLNGAIETISAPIYDKSVYGTQFTELKPIQVATSSDSNFAVGDVFTRGALLGLDQCGVNPSSILDDSDSSCHLMSSPHFSGTFGEELSLMDAGVVNPNRGGLCTASPQGLSSGINVAWRGTSTTKSCYALSTYYDYSFKNAFEQNLSKGWSTGVSPENDSLSSTYHSGKGAGRSYKSAGKLYTVPSIEILLDSQGDHGDAASGDLTMDIEHQIRAEENFVPDGVAVFGRNWGACTLEFCDEETFTTSGGSYRRYEIGQPGDSWAESPTSSSLSSDPERYSHLWAWTNRSDTRVSPSRTPIADGTGNSSIGFGDRTFFYNADTSNPDTSDANTPWIPHQFRSTENGAKFYLQVLCRKTETGSYTKTSNKLVFKILDNTEDKLILDSNPLKCLDPAPSSSASSGDSSMPWHTVSIFSDRFALQLYNYQNSTSGSSSTQSKSSAQSHHAPGTGFRYMKITIHGATRLSQSESSHKLGRIVLGKVKNLAGPDFDWGWSRKEQSGTNITTFKGGQRQARRVHEPRRVFEVSHAPLMPKQVVRNGQSVWEATSRGFGSGSGDFYKHSTKTWNEVLEMLRSLGFGSVQAALVFDDASNAIASKGSARAWQSNSADYDEISYVTVPSEPSNLMLVRMTSVGQISHEGYVCREVVVENGSFKHSNGSGASAVMGTVSERPSPAMKIAQIVFEEEL